MIRPLTSGDLLGVKTLIDANDLFPSALLDDMVAGYLRGQSSDHSWLIVDDGGPIAVTYYAPEPMTQGTWNLYLIAVHPEHQRHGHGAALLQHIEQALTAHRERLLLVETSGLPSFEGTRAFYGRCGYHEEARIREFYQAGEDKVVFRKLLTVVGP